MSQVALTTRVGTGRRRRHASSSGATWGSPATYLVATVLIAICIAPVLYIIIGGFRTNSQITVDPSGWPSPWVVTNYLNVLATYGVGAVFIFEWRRQNEAEVDISFLD